MTGSRHRSEVLALTELAEELARTRHETATTAHLLAAIASRPSAAADLLVERRLSGEAILSAAGSQAESPQDPLRNAILRAHDVATNMGLSEPSAPHLLVALLSDRRSLAHRTAAELGVDVGRLRTIALNVALGLIGRRRLVGSAFEPREATATVTPERTDPAQPPRRPTGVAIPLVPPEKARTWPHRRSDPTPHHPPVGPTPANGPSPPAPPKQKAPVVAAERGRTGKVPSPAPARPLPRRQKPVPPALTPGASRFAIDPKRFPLLTALGRNLTLLAEQGELDPVVGREAEIERALDVLAKRQGNSPLFVGRPGVGKAATIRGLAQRIVESDPSRSFDDRVVVEIPVVELFAGTGVRGALADRFTNLRKEVAAHGRVVLFFDDLPQLFTADGADEIAGELRAALARGALPCLGTATPEQLVRVLGNDPGLGRCFTVVELEEPGREEAFLIAEAASARLAAHHGVEFSEAALARAVNWSIRYLPGQALPEKVIAIADLAGARTRRRTERTVDVEVIAELIAEMADVPVERLLEADGARMLDLERILAERVVGHEAEIHRIARILRRNAAGLVGRRPLGSFLLLGPTGVGKTETAKAVAEVLFHSDTAMTRIDLSEYGEQHAVARLIGAPPGYVGHEAGGQLTEAVRRRPYQVLLLDEIEKAHPDVLLAFLGVLDEGRLTDGRGRTVDFTNTVIFLTSNLGADESGARVKRRVGFGADAGPTIEDRERGVVAAARTALAPELYNRIDEVLVFAPLARDLVREIARRALARLGEALALERKARLVCDPEAIDALLDAGGYDPTLGARPLRRTIARLVEAPLADHILRGELDEGSVVWVTVVDGEVTVDVLDEAPASRTRDHQHDTESEERRLHGHRRVPSRAR
ncbi:MAG: AAA family ATPase [Polyangiaceae bacterium]|nr:AAA family ATPase [Polyangiaceae bacterium]